MNEVDILLQKQLDLGQDETSFSSFCEHTEAAMVLLRDNCVKLKDGKRDERPQKGTVGYHAVANRESICRRYPFELDDPCRTGRASMGFDDPGMKTVFIRADAIRRIGSGYVMRCSVVAEETVRQGGSAVFAVSVGESACFVRSIGFDARILPGNPMALGNEDARRPLTLAACLHARCPLVDSVKNGFLSYSLSASEVAFRDAYRDIPPCSSHWAFLRPPCGASSGEELSFAVEVARTVIASESTNRGRMLERLVDISLRSVPRAKLEVVARKLASFEGWADDRVCYELAAVGVPTIAIAITANQLLNAEGSRSSASVRMFASRVDTFRAAIRKRLS